MFCENCGICHTGQYGSGRFCGSYCAHSHATSYNKEEINKKRSNTLKKLFASRPKKIQKCKTCEKIFHNRLSKYCSKKCSSVISDETRKRLSENAKKRHRLNDGIGFQTRKKFESSYPEKLTENFFTIKGLPFVREKKVGRWFADFEIGKNIIEIDGQQHKLTERKNSDNIKDEFLKKNGYSVTRILWDGNHVKFFEQLEKAHQSLVNSAR